MSTELAIEGRGVVRDRGRFRLGPVDLTLPRGQVMGLVGPNGSGKTTLIKAILGMTALDAGTLSVLGTAPERAKGSVCAVLDAKFFVPGWSVAQAVRAIRPFYPNWDQNYAESLLARFTLDPDAKVKELSHGEGNKLALVLALAPLPELAVLDEPTSGLDPLTREEVMQVIRDYMARRDSSVLFSTHIPADLGGIADQLVAVRAGRVVYSGHMDALTEVFFAVRGTNDDLLPLRDRLIGARSTTTNFEAIVRAVDSGGLPSSVLVEEASIDDVVKALAVPVTEGIAR
ncbi:ATP-binding cassette domain-containing protein [Humibacter albus]|uniref:ATP-binding cassette domain-containing protein n=1 Tax=Humibacter albus TaxID=427754 RepID=UPI0003B648C1|nr:ABC transporter ATP-binding protein [Humibacter albus]